MTESTQTARDVLEGCRGTDECHSLLLYLNGQLEVTDLSYEDVFYPLRHHHAEGLALAVERLDETADTLVWGAGDFIYRAEAPEQTFNTAIDPFSVFEGIQTGVYSVGVVVV